jgi:aryl-alcohol dehydrogenase-like predicted oxidoreductase
MLYRYFAVMAFTISKLHTLYFLAWCLKNENVNSVLLGASTVDQLYTNIQALQVNRNESSLFVDSLG